MYAVKSLYFDFLVSNDLWCTQPPTSYTKSIRDARYVFNTLYKGVQPQEYVILIYYVPFHSVSIWPLAVITLHAVHEHNCVYITACKL